MLLQESWLREWCNPPLSAEEIADRYTLAGLEIGSVTDLAAGIEQRLSAAPTIPCQGVRVAVGRLRRCDHLDRRDRRSVHRHDHRGRHVRRTIRRVSSVRLRR